jgi:hypothetical protein
MEIVCLLPLSRAEIRGKKPGFLKATFDSKFGKPAELMIGKDRAHPRAAVEFRRRR